MSTLREQITARAVACLLNATDAGANVFRSRETAITKNITPAIVVMPSEETQQRMGSFSDVHYFQLAVEIFTRGDPWDQLADSTASEVTVLLLNDSVIRSLQADIRKTSTSYESQEADRTAGVLTSMYVITYIAKSAADASVL